MNHASLFSGIGGFDLAAEWNGWNNVFNCEWEEFPRKVLKHHFPNAKQYEDIKDFNATGYRGRIDVLSGGFPCQPFSVAGKRKGSEDDRHLWPEMLRVIGECQPRWVVGENVRGLVNWAGKDGRVGMVFEACYSDLENLGYSVQSFIVPACATGAPHRRDRVWIVAHSNNIRSNKPKESAEQQGRTEIRTTSAKSCGIVANRKDDRPSQTKNLKRTRGEREPHNRDEVRASLDAVSGIGNAPNSDNSKDSGIVAYSDNTRRSDGHEQVQDANGEVQQRHDRSKLSNTDSRNAPDTDIELPKCGNGNREDGRSEQTERAEPLDESRGWQEFPTVPPICGGDDGLPKELDGITFSKWRRESIKAYGNAIVPQVAHRIFQSISDYESST